MMGRSVEAQQLLSALDAELADSGKRRGTTLTWTAVEAEHLARIADTVDRRVHLQARYDECEPSDAKNLVRLSCEIRQCDSLVSRLLRAVSTDDVAVVSQPESQASRRARYAARKRWHSDATG